MSRIKEIKKTIYPQQNPDFYASYSNLNDDDIDEQISDGAEIYAGLVTKFLENRFPETIIDIRVAHVSATGYSEYELDKRRGDVMKSPIEAIESVLDKRSLRGASDQSLIDWLIHLKTIWKSAYMQKTIDGFIDAIRQTPLK